MGTGNGTVLGLWIGINAVAVVTNWILVTVAIIVPLSICTGAAPVFVKLTNPVAWLVTCIVEPVAGSDPICVKVLLTDLAGTVPDWLFADNVSVTG